MSAVRLVLLTLYLTYACCKDAPEPDWWRHTVVYQIYPLSFQDSDGDGIGDLKGIISQLDYLRFLGVGTIWLSPVYRSPMVDAGYDISDYRDIDPVFGDMGDFDRLLETAHGHGMYVMMDFVPNHTSDQHPWFLESRKGGKENPYADYYIWSQGRSLDNGTRLPPNNWLSRFDGPAWEWDPVRQEYYLHQYFKEQPELNFRNPKVRAEMLDVLRFWLKKGADGFRVDAIKSLFEVEDLSLDEPRTFKPDLQPHQACYLDHIHTVHQPEIHDVIREWRQLFDEWEAQTGHHTFMVMEANDRTMLHSMKYYGSGADFAFNHNLVTVNISCNAACIHSLVDSWLQLVPDGHWPNFVLGSHDAPRIASRVSPSHAVAMNMLLLTLPGTPTTYYGEELAMVNAPITVETNRDPLGVIRGAKGSRDYPRGPMQWTAEENAGFTTGDKPWLPINADYTTKNFEAQISEEWSPVNVYRRLVSRRGRPAFRNLYIQFTLVTDNILAYLRQNPNDPTDVYLIALNLGRETSTNNYVVDARQHVTDSCVDVITAGRVIVDTGHVREELETGNGIELDDVTLEPGDGVLIKLKISCSKGNLKNMKIEL